MTQPYYDVCPHCSGSGQIMEPGTMNMIICDYCKGNGVVAFIEDPNIESEELKLKANPKNVTDTELKDYFKILALTLVSYIINFILIAGDNFIFESIIYAMFWGFVYGALIAFMWLIFSKYLPKMTGTAQIENETVLIEGEERFLKQKKIFFVLGALIVFIFGFFNVILTFLAIIILFLMESVIFGINISKNHKINITFKVLFIIFSILLGVSMVILSQGFVITQEFVSFLTGLLN